MIYFALCKSEQATQVSFRNTHFLNFIRNMLLILLGFAPYLPLILFGFAPFLLLIFHFQPLPLRIIGHCVLGKPKGNTCKQVLKVSVETNHPGVWLSLNIVFTEKQISSEDWRSRTFCKVSDLKE